MINQTLKAALLAAFTLIPTLGWGLSQEGQVAGAITLAQTTSQAPATSGEPPGAPVKSSQAKSNKKQKKAQQTAKAKANTNATPGQTPTDKATTDKTTADQAAAGSAPTAKASPETQEGKPSSDQCAAAPAAPAPTSVGAAGAAGAVGAATGAGTLAGASGAAGSAIGTGASAGAAGTAGTTTGAGALAGAAVAGAALLTAGAVAASGSEGETKVDYTRMTPAELTEYLIFQANGFKLDQPTQEGTRGRERMIQDELQKICTALRGKPVDAETAKKVQEMAIASRVYPTAGISLGDWKRGQALAQEGAGYRLGPKADDNAKKFGGNCYACHQMEPKVTAYGTLGPSLSGFGKTRGNTEESRKYVYEMLYNAHAYFPCTNMPRFGANGFLDQQQIADLSAYLLDPESPVNQ